MFKFFLFSYQTSDPEFDGLTWFDGLAQLILGNPSIFFSI
jgi:hypothetical protein